MKFHRKRRVAPEISMTSMVDVVLLLLFFFMVSTTFNKHTQVKIKLPEANGVETEEQPEMVTLMIDADGTYYLEGADKLPHELVNQKLETLTQALRDLPGDAEQTPLSINADAKTPHQFVIRALEATSAAGFSHLTFATLNPRD